MNIEQVSHRPSTIISNYNRVAQTTDTFAITLQPEQDNVSLSGDPAVIRDILSRYDIENSTPQQMADLSQELYNHGIINLKQHALLSFQPELGPQYEELTGMAPDLTSGRNYIDIWEARLAMDKKFNASDTQIKQTQEILNILKSLDVMDID